MERHLLKYGASGYGAEKLWNELGSRRHSLPPVEVTPAQKKIHKSRACDSKVVHGAIDLLTGTAH